MASIDRLPVFMQQQIIQLLKHAEERDVEINDVAAWQWWVLQQVAKPEGDCLVLEDFRFRKRPRAKPVPGSTTDLSDATLYEL